MAVNVLVVFGRTPCRNVGKSRLRQVLGAAAVDSLVAAFTADVLSWSLPVNTSMLVASTGPGDSLDHPAPAATVILQPDASFGERITAAFDSAFLLGARRVVIVGTDAPTLPAPYVAGCFEGLDSHAATLIPAVDGGWIALGLERPLGGILAAVPWSTDQTCAATREALVRDGRAPVLLPPWYDVDDVVDLERLREDVTDPTSCRRAPRTAALLAQPHP